MVRSRPRRGLAQPRGFQADGDRRQVPADPARVAGHRPGRGAGRLGAGGAGSRGGGGGGRGPADDRADSGRDADSGGLHRSGRGSADAGRHRRAAGPGAVGHGAQHHRPPSDGPPEDHRPDRDRGRLRHPHPEAGREFRVEELPGRRRRRGADAPARRVRDGEICEARIEPQRQRRGLSGGAEQALGRRALGRRSGAAGGLLGLDPRPDAVVQGEEDRLHQRLDRADGQGDADVARQGEGHQHRHGEVHQA
uniref:LigA n=1 Tax=Parastrongyloides trichosuri TaxID=131310 RepID=A0A0N4ZWK8_PARTI